MRKGQNLTGRFDSAGDKDSFKLRLRGELRVSGASEASNQAFFVLVYDGNKRLIKAADKAYTHTFAQGQYTVVISPCDESGLCYQGTRNYTVTFQ